MEKVKMFCDECFQQVDAEIRLISEKVIMRGVEIDAEFEWPVCPNCGSRIANAAVLERNDQRLYEEYRRIAGIPSGDDIRAARSALSLSQRQLADLLGIGVASIQRYEKGALPTEAHAAMMKRLCDPVFLRERLADASFASQGDQQSIAEAIEDFSTPQQESESISRVVMMMMPQVPSEFTGGRAFDAARFREVLVYLAENAKSLFRTKLNKVLFYLDFSAFRDSGIGVTGLRYAHADFGPVPDKFEQVIAAFVDGDALCFEEHENGGQILKAKRGADLSAFSLDERDRLERVAAFANSFSTATALTNKSHREDAWVKTDSGQIISYQMASTLKAI